jgi:hypothetical protein
MLKELWYVIVLISSKLMRNLTLQLLYRDWILLCVFIIYMPAVNDQGITFFETSIV